MRAIPAPNDAPDAARRTVLITGGTGALGRVLVSHLSVQPDVRVVANFRHDTQRAELLQRETGCELLRADVSDEAAVRDAFALLAQSPDTLWAVVHLAGQTRDALLLRQTRDDWREVLKANAESAFLVTRESLRVLPDGGRLVLVASRVGERGSVGQSAYASAKAAVIGLARSAAHEGATRGVTVNAVCPGFVPSALSDTLSAVAVQALQAQSLLPGTDAGQAFACAVLWLLGADAAGVSGQVVHADSRKVAPVVLNS